MTLVSHHWLETDQNFDVIFYITMTRSQTSLLLITTATSANISDQLEKYSAE